MTTIALMGAGGKMGCRITNNIKNHPDYDVRYVEISEAGIANLTELGVSVTPQDEAIAEADVVILAVPDALMGPICEGVVPQVKSGTIIMGLDPAGAYAGVLPQRDDITYFIAHPCHPPLFNDETDPAAMRDWFGGVHAKQHIVCALFQGPDTDYAIGEAVARAIYAPVMRSHRLTVEQMAILEPALVETLAATCVTILKEGLDEVVAMGLPEEAARDFLFGHIHIELAIIFGFAGFPFSDGAKLAIEEAKSQIFQPDWKRVLSLENLQQSVKNITHTK